MPLTLRHLHAFPALHVPRNAVEGSTPLHLVALKGSVPTTKALLRAYVGILCCEACNRTALQEFQRTEALLQCLTFYHGPCTRTVLQGCQHSGPEAQLQLQYQHKHSVCAGVVTLTGMSPAHPLLHLRFFYIGNTARTRRPECFNCGTVSLIACAGGVHCSK